MDWVPIVVAALGAGGIGALLREIVSGATKIAGGMSARESKRADDIVQQRAEAIAREEKAWRQVDAEAKKRRAALDYAARLRRRLIELGVVDPEPEPSFEQTITRAQLSELREKEKES